MVSLLVVYKLLLLTCYKQNQQSPGLITRYLRTFFEGFETQRKMAKGALCKWAVFPDKPRRKEEWTNWWIRVLLMDLLGCLIVGVRPHDLSTKFSTLVENLEQAWILFFFKYVISFVLLLAVLGLRCCTGTFLELKRVGAALAVVRGLLPAEVSPAVEHGCRALGLRLSWLSSCVPRAPEHKTNSRGTRA